MPIQDLDVRVYHPDGTRVYFPNAWISDVSFELSERGGYQNATITALARWEDLTITGQEYVDVFLWGSRVYRGYARMPQRDIDIPEKVTLNCYGPMELLNGFLCLRNFYYGEPTDLADIFADLAAYFVTTSDRLPSLVIDASATGIVAQVLATSGRTISQAFNALCDLAPNQVIWGMEVSGSNQLVLYLRLRSQATKYVFPVGRETKTFAYPPNATQIVNVLYITGGPTQNPNLAPNASFEQGVAPDLFGTNANCLRNAGFETGLTGPSDLTPANWGKYGDPKRLTDNTTDGYYSHSGQEHGELDNFPAGPHDEAFYQAVPVVPNGFGVVSGSCWARQQQATAGRSFFMTLYLMDNTNTVIAQVSSALITPGNLDANYYEFSITQDFATDASVWAPYPGTINIAAVAFAGLQIQCSSACTQDNGILIDDATLWFGQDKADKWFVGNATDPGVIVTDMDWFSTEIPAYHGNSCVKVKATLPSTKTVEICTGDAELISVSKYTGYIAGCFVHADVSGTFQIACGVRLFNGAAIEQQPDSSYEILGETFSITAAAGWKAITCRFRTGADTTGCEMFFRIFSDGVAGYIDAAALHAGEWPITLSPTPGPYITGSTFDVIRRVTDATISPSLPADCASSITDWGIREKAVSVPTILTDTLADAYAISYLTAHASPWTQARLSLFGASAFVGMDGLVRMTNLPNPPAPLFPSRIRYRVTETEGIAIDLDLGNEKPDLAKLLRLTVAGDPGGT